MAAKKSHLVVCVICIIGIIIVALFAVLVSRSTMATKRTTTASITADVEIIAKSYVRETAFGLRKA